MTFEITITGERRNVCISLKHDGEEQHIYSTLRDALSQAAEFMAEKWRQEN